MALRKTAYTTSFKFALSLALAAAPAVQAGTIYDLWDFDHRQGLAGLEGWSLAIQTSTGSGTYQFNFNTGSRRQLAVSADGSEWKIQAGLNNQAVGSTGLYSLDLTYADVNVSIDGAAVNRGSSSTRTAEGGMPTASGSRGIHQIGSLSGPDGELFPIAIADDPGASLKLTRTANGGFDGESSLLICADAACTSVMENSSAKLAFSATGAGAGSGGANNSGSELVMISSLTAASVDAPEPTTYIMLGAGLVLLSFVKRKTTVKA